MNTVLKFPTPQPPEPDRIPVKAPILKQARLVANMLGRKQKYVTAFDVYDTMRRLSMDYRKLGNAAGSVFRGHRWQKTGAYVQSPRLPAKGRSIAVWMYLGSR
jgi:hypothetical protein